VSTIICPWGYTYDSQAFALLKTLFPSWVTLSDALGPCDVCDTLAENSREDKRELRKKAEEEKVDLQRFYCQRYLLTSKTGETQTYARERANRKHGTS
jgi:hypothetical protein